jgi:hypothetical protein
MTNILERIEQGDFEGTDYLTMDEPFPPDCSEYTIAELAVNYYAIDQIEDFIGEYRNYMTELATYKEALEKHEQGKLHRIERFRNALENECNMTNNHKAEGLWNIVWDKAGHRGLREVALLYIDLVRWYKDDIDLVSIEDEKY